MQDNKTLLRQRIFKSRQTQHVVKVNFVATKMATFTTEVEKNYKKLMLRHSKENKAEISVATKEDYVTTIKVVE